MKTFVLLTIKVTVIDFSSLQTGMWSITSDIRIRIGQGEKSAQKVLRSRLVIWFVLWGSFIGVVRTMDRVYSRESFTVSLIKKKCFFLLLLIFTILFSLPIIIRVIQLGLFYTNTRRSVAFTFSISYRKKAISTRGLELSSNQTVSSFYRLYRIVKKYVSVFKHLFTMVVIFDDCMTIYIFS